MFVKKELKEDGKIDSNKFNNFSPIGNIYCLYNIYENSCYFFALSIHYSYSLILEINESSVSPGGRNGAFSEGCP